MYEEHIRAAARSMAENMQRSPVPMYGKGLRLPDKGAVIGLLKEIRRLVFPAYYGDPELMTLLAEDYTALLLERIEGGTFRDNDWGYDEEQDVNSDDDKDLKDMNLKQLEALSGLEGDCSEIDEHLINVVTTMNEMQTFQSTVKVMVNRLVHCRS